ncbi:unnamed protein product [Diatraea saccharalis]|uniref:Major facilitator superfamily (MFS) profile domain-containing protein n=1 Tax=Diatraea saccharalis TaxID=40085 RepID=A0A9N9QZG6_9NEOP|nr:unnamed protein product [Diatraea saccharalis]
MSALEKMENVRPNGLGVRHVQTLLLFFGMLLAFTMRVNMSIAIVAMTANSTGNVTENYSIILSSFFWGYVVLQIPAGAMARRCGGKVLITISLFVNSLTSVFIPVAAKCGGWQLVCACRILQGLTQAFVYPCMHHLISQWVPLEEKGGQLGIAIQLLVGGLIASALGWPAIFYINGSLGAIWIVAYLLLGSATPEQSKFISEDELIYIQRSLGRVGEQKHYAVPWKKIMTCVPFWAVIVAHCGQNWGFFTLMTEMPSYMSKVLGFELKSLVHIDLAPNFSAILMGITNFLANIVSIIAPLVCGFIVTDETDPVEWRKVFFVASGVYFFSNLFFIIFSSSEKQSWNEPKEADVGT